MLNTAMPHVSLALYIAARTQLRDCHFPEAVAKTVLDDIFGSQQGEIFAEGLVDSASNEGFRRKRKKWGGWGGGSIFRERPHLQNITVKVALSWCK